MEMMFNKESLYKYTGKAKGNQEGMVKHSRLARELLSFQAQKGKEREWSLGTAVVTEEKHNNGT